MIGKNKMKDWKACIRTWENITKEKIPNWFNKQNEIKKATKEEQEEIDKILNEIEK